VWNYEKPDNLFEWWMESENKYSDQVLFWLHNEQGGLDPVTYSDIGKRINHTRNGLAQLGIDAGDAVGIIAPNQPEWAVIAYAAWGRNARLVPMYFKDLKKTWEYIIKDSGLKFLIVSSPEIYEQVKDIPREIPTLENIYVIDSKDNNSLGALESLGRENPSEPVIPHFDDVAVLLYTSGTTADPKGVLLTHGNITYVALTGIKLYPDLDEGQVGVSMLPWAHCYGLVAELNIWVYLGSSLGFMRDVTTLADDIRLIRPTYIISVPRVFNKVYDAIHMRMHDSGGIKKKLFDAACETAGKKQELDEAGQSSSALNLKHKLLDKLVFTKIKEAMGGRIKGAITGSAAMNKEIAGFFKNIGIPIYDCYGLTETAPAVTMNSPGACRLGSVGKVLEGQKVVIDTAVSEEGAEDGEIIVYGPNVMKGYHNKPRETEAVIMSDGGFRTGDRGRLDEEGFLWITGRIKEQYKLSNGKYVFPAAIEEEMKLLPNVANAMVYGDGRPFNICLVYPDFAVTERWAAGKGVSPKPEDLTTNENFTAMMTEEIKDHLKKSFAKYEIPEKFLFLNEDFTVENGMLTQTMKLKRRVVLDNYAGEIEQLYS